MTDTQPRFTDALRHAHAETWDAVVRHRFVRELFAGSVPDTVMAGYLVQDYRFFDDFIRLLGAAICAADSTDARITLARVAGEVAGDENTYFLRCFEALGADEPLRAETPDSPATAGFLALMREAVASQNYAAILAVLVVAEWSYLSWARTAPATLPQDFVHAEWVDLHDGPEFRERVAFLRAELDRVGPGEESVAADFFGRAIALERDFFDDAYAHPLTAARRAASGPEPSGTVRRPRRLRA
ncbi:TenA family protein [Falsarthrobacter nasiphocae]|uniref:Aminopyrimidine aminohydrolase n=1 Tax=Falsarthrobacter nasiphocae TaxID=189863 RepID=A0AAE3YJM1_9MICC|nr:TenA family protein [Falsarthrobacter nasiphocae]MDR6892906.1 thiaminase/transcriptional activator TenA [Falsarthrobacter nasiphocae]